MKGLVHTFKTEAELCSAFLSCLPAGWTAYNETGDFDILLVHDETGHQIGIEAKLRLNAKVLCQATDGRDGRYQKNGPDYRAVLVGTVSGDMQTLATRLGIKVLTVGADLIPPWGGYSYQGPPAPKFALPWRCHLPEFVDFKPEARHWVGSNAWEDCAPIKRLDLPEYVPDVDAGHPSPQKLSHWKIAAMKVCVLCERRGSLTRADFRALKISPSRWMDGYTMEKGPVRGCWVPGRYWPAESYRRQHPNIYEQIEADFEKWTIDCGLAAAKQEDGALL